MKIRLEGVSFEFRDRPVLEGITTTIATGIFTCVLGVNGAGKTTLFRLMMGQARPTRGRVSIVENGSTAVSTKDVHRHFAILPQGVQDPPYLTVRELVSLGRFRPGLGLGWRLGQPDRAIVNACLRRCDMESLVDRPFEKLSGGEKQRAWLSFCLAQEKGFLVLDESLDGLDYLAKRAFFRRLAGLAAEGKGILLTTHDLDLAGQFADRVLVLKDGGLCYDGAPRADLLSLLVSDLA